TVDPGAIGSNAYEVDLAQGGQPLSGKQTTLQFVYPALDFRTVPITLDDAGDGSYLGAGPDLDRSGDWLALVNVKTDAGNTLPTRAAFRWPVAASAPTATRQPSILNWLSGLSIIVMAGVLFTPGTVRYVKTLNLQGESVVIGVMALVVTIALFIVGGWLLSDAARRTDALQHPVPSVVNPILPDQASLVAGQGFYTAKCASCHGSSGAGDGPNAGTTPAPDLRNRIPERREEELFQTLQTQQELGGQLSETD